MAIVRNTQTAAVRGFTDSVEIGSVGGREFGMEVLQEMGYPLAQF